MITSNKMQKMILVTLFYAVAFPSAGVCQSGIGLSTTSDTFKKYTMVGGAVAAAGAAFYGVYKIISLQKALNASAFQIANQASIIGSLQEEVEQLKGNLAKKCTVDTRTLSITNLDLREALNRSKREDQRVRIQDLELSNEQLMLRVAILESQQLPMNVFDKQQKVQISIRLLCAKLLLNSRTKRLAITEQALQAERNKNSLQALKINELESKQDEYLRECEADLVTLRAQVHAEKAERQPEHEQCAKLKKENKQLQKNNVQVKQERDRLLRVNQVLLLQLTKLESRVTLLGQLYTVLFEQQMQLRSNRGSQVSNCLGNVTVSSSAAASSSVVQYSPAIMGSEENALKIRYCMLGAHKENKQ